ncbi:MAG: CbtB domain-containing protein [Alphaproteobacteria bacterium]
MNAISTTLTARKSEVLPIFLAALLGIGVIFIAGHVQQSTLHAAAHDVRHANGFPCH